MDEQKTIDITRKAHIKDLFDIIPVNVWDSRDEWIKAVYLAKNEFDETEALTLLNCYCGASDKACDGDQEKMYEVQLSGNQVGIAWLMNLAGIHNQNGLKRLKKLWNVREIWINVEKDVDVELL